MGHWWRLRCHIVDADGEPIDHRAQGWRDCGEQRGPRHAAFPLHFSAAPFPSMPCA